MLEELKFKRLCILTALDFFKGMYDLLPRQHDRFKVFFTPNQVVLSGFRDNEVNPHGLQMTNEYFHSVDGITEFYTKLLTQTEKEIANLTD